MEQNFLIITVGVIGVLIMAALSKEGLADIFNHQAANFCLLFNSPSNNLIIPNLASDEVHVWICKYEEEKENLASKHVKRASASV